MGYVFGKSSQIPSVYQGGAAERHQRGVDYRDCRCDAGREAFGDQCEADSIRYGADRDLEESGIEKFFLKSSLQKDKKEIL